MRGISARVGGDVVNKALALLQRGRQPVEGLHVLLRQLLADRLLIRRLLLGQHVVTEQGLVVMCLPILGCGRSPLDLALKRDLLVVALDVAIG